MKIFRFKNIRVQLFAAFLAAAVLVAVLQTVGILTIRGINARARESGAEIQTNLDRKVQELGESLAITELSEQILRAETHAALERIDPHMKLTRMEAAEGKRIAELLGRLHERNGDFLLNSETLEADLKSFQHEVDALSTEIDSTVAQINGAAISQAEKVQLDLSNATKEQTSSSLQDMQGTVNRTLNNVINTLQLRNDLFAFEIQVRQAEADTSIEADALNAGLTKIREAVTTLPSTVAGDFEIAAINSLLDKIGKNLTSAPDPVSPEAVTEVSEGETVPTLADHFENLQQRLLTIADNVVFDSSFELESYLGDVQSSIGGSLEGLIATQQDLNKALAAASDLEHQGALIRENLNALVFQLQRTIIEQTPEAVQQLQAEGETRLAEIASAREKLTASLAASGAVETQQTLNQHFDLLLERTSGSNGILSLAAAVVRAYGQAEIAKAEIDSAVSGISQAMALSFEALAQTTTDRLAENIAAGTSARNWLLFLGSAILLLSLAMGIFIPRNLSGRIGTIVNDLARVAHNLGDSANAMTQSSDTQARSASEQAATLEESSATLVGLSQMAMKNAETTEQASRIFEQTRQLTTDGTSKMESMQGAMVEIVEASKQIEKIIKTIEEIAFQTNILALNAAVEAARAGEAGAGFGVVAEEVRNLAQKCTEAAKDTSKIIQSNEHRTSQGTQLCDAVGTSLAEINQQVDELNKMVAGIARATKEQSEGIDQLNSGVQSMSAKTQDNAAVAEEGAATSSELDRDARNLRVMLERLRELSGTRVDAAVAQQYEDEDESEDDESIEVSHRTLRPRLSNTGRESSFSRNGHGGRDMTAHEWNGGNHPPHETERDETAVLPNRKDDEELDRFFS